MTLLEQILRERFPTAAEVEAETVQPVGEWHPWRSDEYEHLLAQAERAAS